MIFRMLVFCGLAIVMVMPLQVRAEATCAGNSVEEFLAKIPHVDSWQNFYSFYEQFRPCGDDGVFAEEYSDSVVAFFTAHWDQLDVLNMLTRIHPNFELFALRHLDEMMSPDEDKKIRFQATNQCPKIDKELCRAIIKKLDELDAETKNSDEQ